LNGYATATGRSVITAAGSAAFEGYEGHGLLTYAVLDAFKKPDTGGDVMKSTRLASHVDRLVPIISQRMFGEPQRQLPSRYSLGGCKPSGTEIAIPKTPTHVSIRPELVDRERPRTRLAETNLRPTSTFTASMTSLCLAGENLGATAQFGKGGCVPPI
jgi:hypothetical protein